MTTADSRGVGRSAGRGAALLAAAALLLAGAPLRAQLSTGGAREPAPSRLRARPEVRVDYLGGRTPGLHGGIGISVRAGTYVRVGASAGAGPAVFGARSDRAHADITARFLLDPYRENAVGISVGGGVGARHDDARMRGVVLLVADIEAGRGGGWTPFLRAGIGGGARLTVGLRRAAATGR